MKIIQGNLIELAQRGEFDVIVHGCNCFHTMGAGIAKQIAETWPQALEADKQTPYADSSKMGTYSTATAGPLTIVNAYTQYHFGTHKMQVDYSAIARAFAQLSKEFCGKRIAYPKIGAGLAGGDWAHISSLIGDALKNENHTLVEYVPNKTVLAPPAPENGLLF